MMRTVVRRLRFMAILWMGIACAAVPVGAQTTLNSGVTETRLPNGLRVLTKEVHAAPVVCTYVWYRVGSRNEVPGITGVSHQLEHMMFKGTKKHLKPGDIDLLTGRYGGENNAQTDTDTTSYYFLLPSNQLDLALRIESDRMTQAAIDPKQLAAEKTVVLSELEGDENDNAYFLYENVRTAAYRYHPYHYPVIGTKWDVQHFTREAVYDYYHQHYAPNNATLVIVGDFDTLPTLKRVRELWQDVKPADVPDKPLNPEPPQQGERRVTVRRAGATVYWEMMAHIPQATHADLPALTVLATVLTEGRSSRLYKALVETQLATSVSASANQGIDPEVFDISITARSGVSAEEIEKKLSAELTLLRKDLLDDHILIKVKNQTRAGILFAQESVQAQAARLGFYQTVTGDWRNQDRFLAQINAVTAADVRRVAQTYLVPDNETAGAFVPNGEPPKPEADSGGGGHAAHYRKAAIQSSARAAASPPQTSAQTPPTTERKLANGLTVIVRENHANPTVTVGGFVRAGSVNDPMGKYGLADITAAMLTRGTTTRTSQQIAEATDFVGAHIDADAGRERTDLGAAMLSENFPAILDLLADVVEHPSFPAEELEKVRGETLTALQEAEDDTALVATRRLYAALYPAGNPYAHLPEGSVEDVRRITRDDVLDFYRRAYRPDRTTLILVGDVNTNAALDAVEKAFGGWKGEGEAYPVYVPPTVETTANAPAAPIVVVMPDKSQGDVAMGLLGISRNSPDYEAARLMNLILGGDEFVGRVGKRIRDTEGLAYYAYTAFQPGLEAGPWVFRAGVNPKNIVRALASARDEINKMIAQGVTDAELSWAKDHAVGAMRLSLATNAGVAAQLENDAFYGLGLDYAERYPNIVAAITKAQVDAAARKYLRPGALTVVVAGPPVPGLANAAVPPTEVTQPNKSTAPASTGTRETP